MYGLENEYINENKGFTGVWIPREILEDDTLKPIDKILYAEIASFPDGCWKKSDELQRICGAKQDAFQAACKRLRDGGYIAEQRKFGRIFRRSTLGFTHQREKPVDKHREKPVVHIDNTIDNTIVTNVTTVQPSADTELVYEPIDEFAIKPKKTKQRNRFGNQEVQGIMDLFEDRLGVTLPDADNQRRYAKHLITKFGYAQARAMVSLVLNNQKDKYFAHVATPQDLWYKYPKIKNYIDNYDARNNHGGVTKI